VTVNQRASYLNKITAVIIKVMVYTFIYSAHFKLPLHTTYNLHTFHIANRKLKTQSFDVLFDTFIISSLVYMFIGFTLNIIASSQKTDMFLQLFNYMMMALLSLIEIIIALLSVHICLSKSNPNVLVVRGGNR